MIVLHRLSESEGECSSVEETDMTVYSSAIQPYEDEPLAYDDAENVAGENGDEVAKLEIDEDGIPYATLEARFEKREGVDKWCKCGECNVTELIGAVEYHCCKEIGPALHILTFDGSIEKINCITQHEDYLPLTHPAVLKQAGPLLRDGNGRSYRRRGNQTENELTRAVAYRWLIRWMCGTMGWDNSRPLTACIYHNIRKRFGSSDKTGYTCATARN